MAAMVLRGSGGVVRWGRDLAWALVAGFISLVFALAFTKDPLRAAVIALIVTTLVAIALTVLDWWLRRAKPPPPPPPGPAAIRITNSRGVKLTRNTSIGSPLLEAENLEDLDAQDNVTIMPGEEDSEKP